MAKEIRNRRTYGLAGEQTDENVIIYGIKHKIHEKGFLTADLNSHSNS
jgi:hypothetical protein